MKQKIIILSVVAAVALTVIGIASIGMTDQVQTTLVEPEDFQQISMVIEDNNYVMGGLPPPDWHILDFGDGLDIEDNRGEDSPYYNDVKDIFPGYDEIVIIDHIRENDDPAFDEPVTTYIFLTKEPFEYEALYGEFYYEMVGITIIISEKRDIEKFTMQTPKDTNDIYKEISKDLIGIGHNKFKGKMADETKFDLPTILTFVDNEKGVEIKGFLTLEQAGVLAKALQR